MAYAFPDLTGFTILVIEDDPDGLQVLAMALTACGARVLTARAAEPDGKLPLETPLQTTS